ncbi:WecB/TagA/CpsF family glycosyltransferase [Mycolicibacterium goodii]|uniref:WecB/TagA/CpsF family glycosyltransferase n=1 Tax=Mycolicibacterium goodii TaxID=134601 RepID=UPI001F04D164|nr:WecB/TagA/CpsF family glycosyltransferase [Mycolicibacterium goodii]ULN48666.1 WecB/TagA/CpsF family glycosyltransferase [Mycolicibacterium goodii]
MLTTIEKPAMRVCGTVVTRYTAAEVIALVASLTAISGSPQLAIGSVNLDHLHHFRSETVDGDDDACGDGDGGPQWLWLADGAPVAWRGSRLVAGTWPRVTGADLLEPILDVSVQNDVQVGFLGGTAAMHRRLKRQLAQRYPDAAPAGFWSPSRSVVESPGASAELAAEIRATGVRVLVVGLGKPRQERWVQQHAAETGATVFLAFGAAADFLAGVVDRAPDFYRQNGLEWLYRLRQEPQRLARRYLVQGPPALLRLRHADLVMPYAPEPRGWRP